MSLAGVFLLRGGKSSWPLSLGLVLCFGGFFNLAVTLLSGNGFAFVSAASWEAALFRLFAFEPQEPAFAALILAGLISGIFLLTTCVSAARNEVRDAARHLLGGLLVLLVSGLLVAVAHEPLENQAWRAPQVLLPHVAAALALAWALGLVETRKPLPWKWMGTALAGALMLWAMPRLTQPVSALGLRLDGRRVIRDFAQEQPGAVRAFYALDRPEGLMVEGISAGSPSLLVPGKTDAGLPALLASRCFDKFYLLATSTLNPKEGVWVPDAWQKVPSGLETKVVRERWISTDRKAFVHEVLGVRLKDGSLGSPLVPGSGPRMTTTELTEALSRGEGEQHP